MFKETFCFYIGCLILVSSVAGGQVESRSQVSKPELKKWYLMNSSEIIFSGGSLGVSDAKVNQVPIQMSADNVIRFSAFFHFQQQWHLDFNTHFGFYTGFGIRNIGFINTFSGLEKKIKIKQRSYSLGIPLAFKAGDMNGIYFAAGAEAELMFAYKRKVFYDGGKSKKTQWFSNDINLFNPGLYAEVHFKNGGYIRAKYYLLDLLKTKSESFILPEDGRKLSYNIDSSTLYYISIGTSLKSRKLKSRNRTSTATSI